MLMRFAHNMNMVRWGDAARAKNQKATYFNLHRTSNLIEKGNIMKSKALLIFIPVLLSCSSTVSLRFEPEMPIHQSCPGPNTDQLTTIKKIAILPFENSTYRKHQYINPISSQTTRIQNMNNNMDLFEFLDEDGVYVSNITEREIMNSTKFRLVERRQLNKVLLEQNLSLTGALADNDIKKIGQLSGADAFLTGKVEKAYVQKMHAEDNTGSAIYVGVAYVTIQFKLIDTQSGDIIWSCVLDRNSMNYLQRPMTITNDDVLEGRKTGIIGLEPLIDKTITEAVSAIIK